MNRPSGDTLRRSTLPPPQRAPDADTIAARRARRLLATQAAVFDLLEQGKLGTTAFRRENVSYDDSDAAVVAALPAEQVTPAGEEAESEQVTTEVQNQQNTDQIDNTASSVDGCPPASPETPASAPGPAPLPQPLHLDLDGIDTTPQCAYEAYLRLQSYNKTTCPPCTARTPAAAASARLTAGAAQAAAAAEAQVERTKEALAPIVALAHCALDPLSHPLPAPSMVVHVVGAPVAGKTTLAGAVSQRAQAAGANVLTIDAAVVAAAVAELGKVLTAPFCAAPTAAPAGSGMEVKNINDAAILCSANFNILIQRDLAKELRSPAFVAGALTAATLALAPAPAAPAAATGATAVVTDGLINDAADLLAFERGSCGNSALVAAALGAFLPKPSAAATGSAATGAPSSPGAQISLVTTHIVNLKLTEAASAARAPGCMGAYHALLAPPPAGALARLAPRPSPAKAWAAWQAWTSALASAASSLPVVYLEIDGLRGAVADSELPPSATPPKTWAPNAAATATAAQHLAVAANTLWQQLILPDTPLLVPLSLAASTSDSVFAPSGSHAPSPRGGRGHSRRSTLESVSLAAGGEGEAGAEGSGLGRRRVRKGAKVTMKDVNDVVLSREMAQAVLQAVQRMVEPGYTDVVGKCALDIEKYTSRSLQRALALCQRGAEALTAAFAALPPPPPMAPDLQVIARLEHADACRDAAAQRLSSVLTSSGLPSSTLQPILLQQTLSASVYSASSLHTAPLAPRNSCPADRIVSGVVDSVVDAFVDAITQIYVLVAAGAGVAPPAPVRPVGNTESAENILSHAHAVITEFETLMATTPVDLTVAGTHLSAPLPLPPVAAAAVTSLANCARTQINYYAALAAAVHAETLHHSEAVQLELRAALIGAYTQATALAHDRPAPAPAPPVCPAPPVWPTPKWTELSSAWPPAAVSVAADAFRALPPLTATIVATLPPPAPAPGKPARQPAPVETLEIVSADGWCRLSDAEALLSELQLPSEVLPRVAVRVVTSTRRATTRPTTPATARGKKVAAQAPEWPVYDVEEIEILHWPRLLRRLALPASSGLAAAAASSPFVASTLAETSKALDELPDCRLCENPTLEWLLGDSYPVTQDPKAAAEEVRQVVAKLVPFTGATHFELNDIIQISYKL